MKRILLLAMCFLLMYSFCVTVNAEDAGIYENAGKLYEAWTSQGSVPDYISGVWSTDGSMNNLTFGVVMGESGEKGQQEILSLVLDDSTVTIVDQTYSRNYLYKIQEEIVDAYFDKGLGLVTAGVSERENKLLLEVKDSFADNADTQSLIQQITAQYGDAVSFRFIDSDLQIVAEMQPETTSSISFIAIPEKPTEPIIFIFLLCAITVIILLITEIRRRQLAAMTANGSVFTYNVKKIHKNELITAIRMAEIKPSAALDDRIMESICYSEYDAL